MKKCFTLIMLLAVALGAMAEPKVDVGQLRSKAEAGMTRAAQRVAARANSLGGFNSDNELSACPDSVLTWKDGELDTKRVITYNADRKPETETCYSYKDGGWEFYSNTVSTYVDGKLQTKVTTGYKGDVQRSTFTYDAQGRISREDTEVVLSGVTYPSYQVCTYSEGKYYVETYDCTDSDPSNLTLQIALMTYVNAQDQITRVEEYMPNKESGGVDLFGYSDYDYKADGSVVCTFYMNMGDGQSGMTQYGTVTFSYEYDNEERLTRAETVQVMSIMGFEMSTSEVSCYYYGSGAHVDNMPSGPAIISTHAFTIDGRETTDMSHGIRIIVTRYADGSRSTVKKIIR